jgi:hypothetical protein
VRENSIAPKAVNSEITQLATAAKYQSVAKSMDLFKIKNISLLVAYHGVSEKLEKMNKRNWGNN